MVEFGVKCVLPGLNMLQKKKITVRVQLGKKCIQTYIVCILRLMMVLWHHFEDAVISDIDARFYV